MRLAGSGWGAGATTLRLPIPAQVHSTAEMRQSNGCPTPAPRSSAAKQWLEELAQKMKKNLRLHETHDTAQDSYSVQEATLTRH